jgi:hypothetical protein
MQCLETREIVKAGDSVVLAKCVQGRMGGVLPCKDSRASAERTLKALEMC